MSFQLKEPCTLAGSCWASSWAITRSTQREAPWKAPAAGGRPKSLPDWTCLLAMADEKAKTIEDVAGPCWQDLLGCQAARKIFLGLDSQELSGGMMPRMIGFPFSSPFWECQARPHHDPTSPCELKTLKIKISGWWFQICFFSNHAWDDYRDVSYNS